jgi:hypothetical protein
MARLLVPEVAVGIAPRQQLLVPSNIFDCTAFEHQNGICRHQGR